MDQDIFITLFHYRFIKYYRNATFLILVSCVTILTIRSDPIGVVGGFCENSILEIAYLHAPGNGTRVLSASTRRNQCPGELLLETG